MALFGGTADERREPRSLVEFRAGKMSLSQGVVTADKRKGLVYMKTSSDSLLHFCWKDRQTGEVVDVRPYYINFPQPFPCLSHISLTLKPFLSLPYFVAPSFPHFVSSSLPPSLALPFIFYQPLSISCVRTSSSSPARRNLSPSPSVPPAESFS